MKIFMAENGMTK